MAINTRKYTHQDEFNFGSKMLTIDIASHARLLSRNCQNQLLIRARATADSQDPASVVTHAYYTRDCVGGALQPLLLCLISTHACCLPFAGCFCLGSCWGDCHHSATACDCRHRGSCVQILVCARACEGQLPPVYATNMFSLFLLHMFSITHVRKKC